MGTWLVCWVFGFFGGEILDLLFVYCIMLAGL